MTNRYDILYFEYLSCDGFSGKMFYNDLL